MIVVHPTLTDWQMDVPKARVDSYLAAGWLLPEPAAKDRPAVELTDTEPQPTENPSPATPR